jgi:hypothetical protein
LLTFDDTEIFFRRPDFASSTKVSTMPPKRKEGEETNQEPKKIKVVMILNEVTGRYVREDGAVGKKILEKQKEDEKRMKEELERDKREEMDKLIYEAKLHEAERENERLRTLVSPEMLAAAYEAPCNHGWFNAEKSFGNELWRCKICRKEWKPFGELSDEEAAEKVPLYVAQKAAEQVNRLLKSRLERHLKRRLVLFQLCTMLLLSQMSPPNWSRLQRMSLSKHQQKLVTLVLDNALVPLVSSLI